MDSDLLFEEARNSISRFCAEECKAYCCRKGFLMLTAEEASVTIGDKRAFLESNRFLQAFDDGKSVLNLGNPEGCPMLKDFRCTIHEHPLRSKGCKNFPIRVKDKKVSFASYCPAVQENKFYGFIHKIKKLGFEVEW